MRIIIINPRESTITEVDVPGQVDWRVLKERIGGYISAAGTLPNGDILWVDDEGLLKGADAFFSYESVNTQPLAGIGVITGPEKGYPDAEIVDAQTPLAEVQAQVIFLGQMTATRMETATFETPDGVTHIVTTPIIEPSA